MTHQFDKLSRSELWIVKTFFSLRSGSEEKLKLLRSAGAGGFLQLVQDLHIAPSSITTNKQLCFNLSSKTILFQPSLK